MQSSPASANQEIFLNNLKDDLAIWLPTLL